MFILLCRFPAASASIVSARHIFYTNGDGHCALCLGLLILSGAFFAFNQSRWHLLGLIPLLVAIYFFNFEFAVERMFLEPDQVVLKSVVENTVDLNRQIVGVVEQGEARAYPIQFLAYHHKLQDTIAGKRILVTYCKARLFFIWFAFSQFINCFL